MLQGIFLDADNLGPAALGSKGVFNLIPDINATAAGIIGSSSAVSTRQAPFKVAECSPASHDSSNQI